MEIVFLILVGTPIVSFLPVFICLILLPTAMNQEKVAQGYGRGAMFGIPEMYQKEWYREDKLWIRKVMIFGQIIFCLCMAMIYFLPKLGLGPPNG